MKQVILVDKDDNEIGQAEKLYAHQHCLLHRAFSIFIYRFIGNKVEYLLHKRNENKYHSGGLWTNTCCSHPQPSESLFNATLRRLKEEVGIVSILNRVGQYYYKAKVGEDIFEHEITHIFVGKWEGDDIKLDPEEIEECRWMSAAEIGNELRLTPDKFTAWFKEVFNKVQKYEKDFIR